MAVSQGAWIWIVISAILLLFTVCATTPAPFGLRPPADATAPKPKPADRSTTDPVSNAGGAAGLSAPVVGAKGLIQSGGNHSHLPRSHLTPHRASA